ncbi:hypothetical protein V6Z12_A05G299900 [Gossypium hirsutum]
MIMWDVREVACSIAVVKFQNFSKKVKVVSSVRGTCPKSLHD